MDMGADDFISKPFTSKVMLEKIKTILSNPKIKYDEGLFKDGDDKQKPFETF